MPKRAGMDRISEKQLIEQAKQFFEDKGFVVSAECHFGEDDDELPDVKIALRRDRWGGDFPDYLLLEAKSHHSTDSPNTINKVFGQLLKETGKVIEESLSGATSCLGVLIPEDAGTWTANEGTDREKTYRRPSGISYYQEGFRRIPADKYRIFGALVDARYVVTYSRLQQRIQVFDWNGFYHRNGPILVLS